MTGSDDTDLRDYYARRSREERRRAAACTDHSAAIAHRTMADEYDRRIAAQAAPAMCPVA